MSLSFSIIMPNYNSCFLDRAILSVIKQTYRNWELIIIDNYSTNFPEKIISRFNDNRIKFYKFNNQNNIAKSRNFGIKKARYDWIAFLDSDDGWEKNKLSMINKEIQNNNPDFLYHGMYFLPKKLGFIKKIIDDKSKEIKKPIFNSLIINGNGIANSSAVVKKDLLKEINYLSEDYLKFAWEDYDCWIRCSKKTDNFLYIPKILGYCWIGQDNISSIDQSFINYKNFHKIYKTEILKLTRKKRLDWFGNFLLIWHFKKKNFKKAYILLKKYPPQNFKSFLRSLLIKLQIYFKKYTN